MKNAEELKHNRCMIQSCDILFFPELASWEPSLRQSVCVLVSVSLYHDFEFCIWMFSQGLLNSRYTHSEYYIFSLLAFFRMLAAHRYALPACISFMHCRYLLHRKITKNIVQCIARCTTHTFSTMTCYPCFCVNMISCNTIFTDSPLLSMYVLLDE